MKQSVIIKTALIALSTLLIFACIGEDVIYPEIDTSPSDTTTIDTLRTERIGIFNNTYSDHYTTIGTVKLVQNADSSLTIIFQDDTEIGSGPSLYLLLTNSSTPSFSVDLDGVNRTINATSAQISFNKLSKGFTGTREFDVPKGIKLEDYKYVTWYCTYGPIFGIAELN